MRDKIHAPEASPRTGERASRRGFLAVPVALRPEDFVAVIDTREQAPLDLAPLRTVRGTLETGDYSIRGLEHLVAVERKSLSDLVACVGRERERFERELRRLRAYPVRALVVEASWADLEGGAWRGEVRPGAVTGSVLSWIAAGIPVLLVGDRRRAALAVRGILLHAARHRLRELAAFANTLRTEEDDATQLGCPDRSACP